MKQINSWLTLSLAGLSLLLLSTGTIVWLITAHAMTLFAIASALCWGVAFALFARFGRLARAKARRIFGVSLLVLLAGLAVCFGSSLLLFFM